MIPTVVRALLPALIFSIAAYGGAFTWRSVEGNAEKYLAQAGKTIVSADCKTLKEKTAEKKQDASFEKISGGAKDNLKDRCLGAVITPEGKKNKKANKKLTASDYKCTGEKAHVELLPGGKVTIVSRGQDGVKEGKCSTVICSGGKCSPAKITDGVKASDLAGVKPTGPADTTAKKLSEALKKEAETGGKIDKLKSESQDPISGAFTPEGKKALEKAEVDKKRADELIKQWGETGAVPPIAASELRDHFRQTAEKICAAGMCFDKTPEEYATYLQEKAKHESKFNPEAAYKRAKGMTQVETNTAKDNMETYREVFGGTEKYDPYNPQHSIQMGGIVLAAELERCNGDMHCALRAYNAGFGRKDIPVAHRYADAVIEGANRVFAGEPPSGRISGNTVGEVKGPLAEFYRRIAQPEYVNTPDVDPTVRPTRLAGTIQPTSLVLSPTPYSDNTFISAEAYQKYDYPGVAPTPTPTPQPSTELETEYDEYSGFTYPKYPKEPEAEPTRFAGNPDPRLGEDVLGSTGPTQPTQAECTTFACAVAREMEKPVAERNIWKQMMPSPQISERGPTLDELLQRPGPGQPQVSFLSTTQSPTPAPIPLPTEHFGGTEPTPRSAFEKYVENLPGASIQPPAYDFNRFAWSEAPGTTRDLTSGISYPDSPTPSPYQEDYRKVGTTPTTPTPNFGYPVPVGGEDPLGGTGPIKPTQVEPTPTTQPSAFEKYVQNLPGANVQPPAYDFNTKRYTWTEQLGTVRDPESGVTYQAPQLSRVSEISLAPDTDTRRQPPTISYDPISGLQTYDYAGEATTPATAATRGLTTEPTPTSPTRIAPPQEDYRKVGPTPVPAPTYPYDPGGLTPTTPTPTPYDPGGLTPIPVPQPRPASAPTPTPAPSTYDPISGLPTTDSPTPKKTVLDRVGGFVRGLFSPPETTKPIDVPPVTTPTVRPESSKYAYDYTNPTSAPKSPTSVYQGEYRELSPTPAPSPYQEPYRTELRTSVLGTRSLTTEPAPSSIPLPTEHFGGTEPTPVPVPQPRPASAPTPTPSPGTYDPISGLPVTDSPTPKKTVLDRVGGFVRGLFAPPETTKRTDTSPTPTPTPTPTPSPYQEPYRTEPKISELGVRSITPRYPLAPTELTPTSPTRIAPPQEDYRKVGAYDWSLARNEPFGEGLRPTTPAPTPTTPERTPTQPTPPFWGLFSRPEPKPKPLSVPMPYDPISGLPTTDSPTPTTPTPMPRPRPPEAPPRTPTTPTPTTPTPTIPAPTPYDPGGLTPIPVPKPRPKEAPPPPPASPKPPASPTPPAPPAPPTQQPGPQNQQQTGGPPGGMPSLPSMPGGGSQGGGGGGQQQGTQQPIPQSQPCSILNQFFGNCPQPTCTLSAALPTVELGKGVTLSWQTQNVFSAQITGVGQVPPANTSINVFPSNTTTYNMEVQSQTGQRASCQTTVNVTPRPTQDDKPTFQVAAELSCAPKTAEVGYNIGITFACRNAEKAEGTGFETGGELEGEASAEIAPPEAKSVKSVTYKLTCTDKGGKKATEQCSVDILRTSIVLVANSKEIASGDMANIGWATVGMKSCVVSSDQLTEWNAEQKNRPKTKGVAKTPALTGDTDFTLTCETKAGSIKTAKATVSVK